MSDINIISTKVWIFINQFLIYLLLLFLDFHSFSLMIQVIVFWGFSSSGCTHGFTWLTRLLPHLQVFAVGLCFFLRIVVILQLFCTFGHLYMDSYLHEKLPTVVSVTETNVAYKFFLIFWASWASLSLLSFKIDYPNMKIFLCLKGAFKRVLKMGNMVIDYISLINFCNYSK